MLLLPLKLRSACAVLLPGIVGLVCLFLPPVASAQIMNATDPSKDPVSIAQGGNPMGMLVIHVVGDDGLPLKDSGVVTLLRAGEVSGPNQVTNGSDLVRFNQLANAAYTVIVSVVGYKDAREETEITAGMSVSEMTVKMERATDASADQDTAKGVFLAPKAKKEAQKGLDALRAGNYDEAQKHLEAAYHLAPGNPDLNDRMGEFYLATKKYDQAESYLKRALSIEPENGSALTDMGWLRVEQGDNDAAQTMLQRAVTADPNRWFTYWLLGLTYLRQGEYEQARVESLAAIKAGKGQAADAEYLLGESLALLGRNAEAIEALQSLLKDAPGNSNAASAQELIAKLQAAGSHPLIEPASPSSQIQAPSSQGQTPSGQTQPSSGPIQNGAQHATAP